MRPISSGCPLALPGGCLAGVLHHEELYQLTTGQGDRYTYDDVGSIPGSSLYNRYRGEIKVWISEEIQGREGRERTA